MHQTVPVGRHGTARYRERVDAGSRFGHLTAKPFFPLDEVAMLIAAHAYPELDVDAQLVRLDELAEGCPEPTLDGLLRQLFGRLRFRGNRADYYDPRNSLMNDVLDRRLGIPISLAVLTIEVGRRLGVPLYGVGMPGHFLVGDRVTEEVFVDVFAGGVVLDAAGCERLFASVADPKTFDVRYLEPAPPLQIVRRMLANLRAVYRASGDHRSLSWVLDLACRLPGADPGTHADHGAVLAWCGRHLDAAAAYTTAAELAGAEEAEEYRQRARNLHARLN